MRVYRSILRDLMFSIRGIWRREENVPFGLVESGFAS